jgi:hypothetical protein
MKTLYIAWRDALEMKWYPVGRLQSDGASFTFCYTRGAREADRFVLFGQMDDLDGVYTSDVLFPIFENRIMATKRPEFDTFINWLGLQHIDYDPVEVLALTEGRRGTDSIEVFPCPEKSRDGVYRMAFFIHGIRHLHEAHIDALEELKPGDSLALLLDPQNRYDKNAVMLRTDDPIRFVGYCPRYLTVDLHELLGKTDPQLVRVSVERINFDAPLQYKMMCKIVAPWPEGFIPCSHPHFSPIPVTRNRCPMPHGGIVSSTRPTATPRE